MDKKFPSIAHLEQYGYRYDSQAFDTAARIEGSFRMFETYGDGLIQHSGDWSIDADHLADYLASLTAVMLEDEELTDQIGFRLLRAPGEKLIEFAASVIFKPTDKEYRKARYVSIKEMKISSAASKEHDKRYEPIAEWMNGSPEAIYRLTVPDFADGLERYASLRQIREWTSAHDSKRWMDDPTVYLKWFTSGNGGRDRDKATQLRHAYDAARAAVLAHQYRYSAKGALENYTSDIENARKRRDAAEKAKAQANAEAENEQQQTA